MTGIRSSQQEVGSLLLLPFLLLLLLVISVVGNTCGCWSTGQVYVQYKPPVTGWFLHSPRRHFSFQRVYTIHTPKSKKLWFQLLYSKNARKWALLERKDGKWNDLSDSRQNGTKQFFVSCPTGQCSCRSLHVEGSSCWSINGMYSKPSNNSQSLQKLTDSNPRGSRMRESQCLLAYLLKCLKNKTGRKQPEDSCHQYTEPLISNTEPVRKQEYYVNHYSYNLTKAKDHDFWLIESDYRVYAISRNTGPCPDQLTPNSNAWVRSDGNYAENITVTCFIEDNPSGD